MQDNDLASQFEQMINRGAKGNAENKPDGDKIYVSYQEETPDALEKVQAAGDLFSQTETRREFLKTQEPNATFRGKVTKLDKWKDAEGGGIINLSYSPTNLRLPFSVGLQVSQGDESYDLLMKLPDDYRGEIVVKTDKNGFISSISLP